jgi:DNA-binding NarL/FixJ family response regulator
MDTKERELILGRYAEHARRFDQLAQRRQRRYGDGRTVARPSPAAKEVGRAASVARLSPREREVLALIARGYANREIAPLLCLSEETVKTYVTLILGKLGARNRAHAVAIMLTTSSAVEDPNAGGGSRTHTPRRAEDFKSPASTGFATPAGCQT